MPFIKYSRDKRGYESTVVMHAYRSAEGPQQTRVLYVFRSLAHLKMGRKALDAEVVEALEHTHPDLSFDWTVLLREPTREAAREDARARYARSGGRQAKQGARRGASRPTPPPAVTPPPVADDQTVLGQALGAREAGRLRGAFAQLLERIARRSRTPEERDRLAERAARLNPDEWSDEATVKAQAAGVEPQWSAILAELPTRRRGRRGGRRREPVGDATTAGRTEASGIMAVGGVDDEKANDDEPDRPNRTADGGGDDGRVDGPADGPADPVSNDS